MLTPSLPPLGRASPNAAHCLSRTLQRARLRDKPGGLVVDYLGLADQLKHALANYTESGGKGDPTYDTKQAIAIMLEKHGIACEMLHGSGWGFIVGGGKKTLFALSGEIFSGRERGHPAGIRDAGGVSAIQRAG